MLYCPPERLELDAASDEYDENEDDEYVDPLAEDLEEHLALPHEDRAFVTKSDNIFT